MNEICSHIRKGRTLEILWAVKSSIALSKSDLKLERKDPNGLSEIIPAEDWTLTGNVIQHIHEGRIQKVLGLYSYTLWYNKDLNSQSLVDKTFAYTLVARSEQEDIVESDTLSVRAVVDLGTADFTARPIMASNGGGGGVLLVTYNELKALRDSGYLLAGAWYQLTDYECITNKENTFSAGHQFDLLIQALTNDTLAEECYACRHSGGDDYFSKSNLAAWKVWYSLDDNFERFDWLDTRYSVDYLTESTEVTKATVIETAELDGLEEYGMAPGLYDLYDGGVYLLHGTEIAEGETYQGWYLGHYYGAFPVDITITKINNVSEHKGVIFRLIDEFGNDCPYDFKNIMFKRCRITDASHVFNQYYLSTLVGQYGKESIYITVDENNFRYCFTFDHDGTDASLDGDYHNNRIAYTPELQDNVFYGFRENVGSHNVTIGNESNGTFYGINENVAIGSECHNIALWETKNITIGNNCNTIALHLAHFVTIYGDCFEIDAHAFSEAVIHSGCYLLSIKSSGEMQIGATCRQMTLDNMLRAQFGNICTNITNQSVCSNCTFGNGCENISLGKYCNYNTFLDGAKGITLGNNCEYNNFGNGCEYITFGAYVSNSRIGIGASYVTLSKNIRCASIGSRVYYVTVEGGANSTHLVENISVLEGTSGTSGNILQIPFDADINHGQHAALNKNGEVKVWCPADMV